MDIIFLWDSDLNHNDTGIMLSGKYFITYDWKIRELCIKRNDSYVAGFWGKHIQDCFAIVGDNGAGKTMLVNCIMECIREIKTDLRPRRTFLMVGEDEKDGTLWIYSAKIARVEVTAQKGVEYRMCPFGDSHKFYLREYEVAYFHNVLSRHDYFAKSRCKYDFALGTMMSQHHGKTYEMHYDRIEKDVVKNYYDKELFRIITFLYDEEFQDKLHMEFPMPKRIYIRIADENFNEKYIIKETKELEEYKNDIEWEKDVESFKRNVDKIAKISQEKWASHTVKNLILNCYKDLCIPQSSPSYNMVSPQVFFEACDFLEDTKAAEIDLYKCAFEIIEKLLHDLTKEIHKERVNRVKEFILWLKENRGKIRKFERKMMRQLDIEVNQYTKAFMAELITLYSEMNFEFPFYDFAFDVSTGEFDFLTVFSNLYSMAGGNNSERNVYDYPKLEEETKSILLIFDEADISMHPKWQRMYMKWLTDFCGQIFGNRDIKIIVTTHSPIMLSDFPPNSILYLERERGGKVSYIQKEKKTFGCNVHSLYLDAFFLEEEGTMGAFAEQKINEIAEMLLRKSGRIKDDDYERTRKMIDYIGEGLIRKKLEEELNRDTGGEKAVVSDEERTVLRDTLTKLRAQRNYMDGLIKELEDKIDDKNTD